MARIISPFDITGSIGELTFYKMNGKNYVKQKSRISGKRLKQDPVFARFREGREAFQKRVKLASLIRKTFQTYMPASISGGSHQTLMKKINEIVRPEQHSEKILLEDIDLSKLEYFSFNGRLSLPGQLDGRLKFSFDDTKGLLHIMLPKIPPYSLDAPDAANSFRIIIAAAKFDLSNLTAQSGSTSSDYYFLGSHVPAQTLTISIEGKASIPILITAALEYSTNVNGTYYPTTTTRQPCQIIKLLK